MSFSGYLLIEEFPIFRGRIFIVETLVTAAAAGKRYQIDFYIATKSGATAPTESDKIAVGSTESFTTTGELAFVRLDTTAVPLFQWGKLYGRVQVLEGTPYAPGDVTATFTIRREWEEGQFCRTQCENFNCQTLCQASCQEYCQNHEETGCNVTCQVGCQGLGNQTTCAVACQELSEYYCHTGEETGCSLDCQTTCQLDDTTSCTHTCETVVQLNETLSAPPAEIDDSTVAGSVLFQFRYDTSGNLVSAGNLFLIGQDVISFDLSYKIVTRDAPNYTIATTAWTSFGFSLPTQTAVIFNPDGFQASNGDIWITFVAFNTSGFSQPGVWVTKSTDLGATWETPVSIPGFGQLPAPTIFEDPDGVVLANVRSNKIGTQDPSWPDVGVLSTLRCDLSDTAATLGGGTIEQLFPLPVIFRNVTVFAAGIGSGGMKMRYNSTTAKYVCLYIQR